MLERTTRHAAEPATLSDVPLEGHQRLDALAVAREQEVGGARVAEVGARPPEPAPDGRIVGVDVAEGGEDEGDRPDGGWRQGGRIGAEDRDVGSSRALVVATA